MEDFILPGIIISAGGTIGAIIAWIFSFPVWIGALIGISIPTLVFLGFYLALFSILAGFVELITGGK